MTSEIEYPSWTPQGSYEPTSWKHGSIPGWPEPKYQLERRGSRAGSIPLSKWRKATWRLQRIVWRVVETLSNSEECMKHRENMLKVEAGRTRSYFRKHCRVSLNIGYPQLQWMSIMFPRFVMGISPFRRSLSEPGQRRTRSLVYPEGRVWSSDPWRSSLSGRISRSILGG